MPEIDGYEYRVDGGPPIDCGLVHSATVSGLTSNTSYDFELRSYGDGRVSEWSSVVTESTLFLPSSLSGLVQWLKADAITGLADNDPISTWEDSSSNNKDATRSGTSRPTYQTNEQNGMPIVRFDGVNDYFDVGSFASLTAGEIFVVIKLSVDPTTGAATGLWAYGSAAGVGHYAYIDNVIYESFGTTVRKTVGNPTPSLAAWRVYNVFSAASDWAANLDGTALHTTATNTVGFASACTLGGGPALGVYLKGDIAELVLYDRKLTAPERATVLAHLEGKWAV